MEKYEVYLPIYKFINEMHYLENENVLGVFFYGSYQIGCANEYSDIDLHIIFNNKDPKHLIRGNHFVDGFRIEYFEKPLEDMYLTIDNDFENQNNALLSIVGTSEIIYDKTGELRYLQQYALDKFETPLPPLDENSAKEMVSIINNRMDKLERSALYDDPDFIHLYHITVEKIRKFYHHLIGSSKIQTTKVAKIYTDEEYRKLINKGVVPEKKFRDMYIDACRTKSIDKIVLLDKVKKLYSFAIRNVNLDKNSNYRIPIRSRNEDHHR